MLLEVILSVLIIASGLVLVIRSYTTSLRVSRVARSLSKACLLLEDKLFDIDVEGFSKGIKEREWPYKEFEDEPPGYNWYLNTSPLDTKKELSNVDLGVTYKVGNQVRKVGIFTYLKYKEW